MKRRLLVLSSLAVLAGFVAADSVEARGGGGGRGGGAGRAAGRAGRTNKKDDKKKDIEAARERLRQMDYRDQDSSRDRA